MRIENGIVILEKEACIHCKGKGKVELFALCRNDGIKIKGGCPQCNSSLKNHNYVKGPLRPCGACDGTGQVNETNCSTLSKEVWDGFAFKVIYEQRQQTLHEYLLGSGCWSCTDYGTAWQSRNDDKLIADARKTYPPQICKVTDENLKIASFIGIFVHPKGYTVQGVFPKADGSHLKFFG